METAQFDAADAMPGKLNAADSMPTPLVNNNLKIKLYILASSRLGIELVWHQVGLASRRRHRVGDIDPSRPLICGPLQAKHLVITQDENDGVKMVPFYGLQQNVSVKQHMI